MTKNNPEVSRVRPLLEGMEGFSSPFESLRTILWYFSVGLYEVKYNPTEMQLVLNLVVLTFIKKVTLAGIRTQACCVRSRRLIR